LMPTHSPGLEKKKKKLPRVQLTATS